MNTRFIALGLAGLLAIGATGWALQPGDAPEGWLGYIEGEAIMIAAPVSGTLARLDVVRGGQVAVGAPLFALNTASADAETRRLEAQRAQARSNRDDLAKPGQRPAELGVARAQAAAAQAELIRAQRDYDRSVALAAKGFVSKAALDSRRAALQAAQASLSGARASEASGALAGRADQLKSAEAAVAAAEAALAAQRRRGDEIAPAAPVSALVEQTYYNPGEWVNANQPVVRLLEPGRIKIRFYAPQDQIARLKPGTRVAVSCDGCGPPFAATIRYVAPQAEFTPPVIYSERARAKLVFLVEAVPAGDTRALRPGLPVEVRPR